MAQHLLGAVAEDTRSRIVKRLDGALDVGGDDAVSHIVEDGLGVLRTVSQGGFGLFPLNSHGRRMGRHRNDLLMARCR